MKGYSISNQVEMQIKMAKLVNNSPDENYSTLLLACHSVNYWMLMSSTYFISLKIPWLQLNSVGAEVTYKSA